MKSQRKYSLLHLTHVTFMILTLLWLTISTPFIYNTQQELAKLHKMANVSLPDAGNEEKETNPFDNSTEEKVPTDENSFSEEYLHDNYKTDYFSYKALQSYKCENTNTYLAFHDEILVPPPMPHY